MIHVCLVPTYRDAKTHAPSHSDFIKDAIHESASQKYKFVSNVTEADLIIVTEAWRHLDLPFYIRARRKLRSLSQIARTFILCDADEPIYLGPGVYVSASNRVIRSDQVSGCYISQSMRRFENIPIPRNALRKNLTFFSGTVSNHRVRQKLVKEPTLAEFVRPHLPDLNAAEDRYRNDLLTSKFALCPRGKGSSSFRLFEAMSVGCVPIIISDEWVEPPLIDWSSCSIRIAENQLHNIVEIISAHHDKVAAMSDACVKAYKGHFCRGALPTYIVESLSTIDYVDGHVGRVTKYEIVTELKTLLKIIYRQRGIKR